MQYQPTQRLAGATARLGVSERRAPRWVEDADAGRLRHYEDARSALAVR